MRKESNYLWVRLLAPVLCALLVEASLPLEVLGYDSKPLSIAVVPVLDGDEDVKSREFAGTLGSSIEIISSHHVVNSDLTANVLDYYSEDEPAVPSDIRGAEEMISKAKENYFQFKYAEANGDIKKALAILEGRNGDTSVAGPKLIDAYLTNAIIAKSRSDSNAVRESVRKALKLNPNLDISNSEYPPSIVSIYEEEKRALNQLPSGSVSVTTRPAVAEIYLNGLKQGVAPMVFSALPEGSYRIDIKANKYETIARQVEVGEGKYISISEKLRWAGDSSEKMDNKTHDAAALVREGTRIADLLKVDKVILVDADSDDDGCVSARMVDGKMRAGQPPVVIPGRRLKNDDSEAMAELAGRLTQQAKIDIAKNPVRNIDPLGEGEPVLLSKRKNPLFRSPVFWGVVGALAAGALGGGLAAAFDGGSGSGIGSVRVEFKGETK